MSAGTVSRGSRAFVAASAGWLVVALTALVAATPPLSAVPARAVVVLGLYGFVLHVVFGKAYALVPTYFDRSLAAPRAPAVQLPLSAAGTAGLAAATTGSTPSWVGSAGAVAWAAGVAVFVVVVVWTIRGNLTGAETATGEAKADRRPVDRLANAAVPVVLAYLLAGSYATLGGATPLAPLVDGYPPRASHLLAAGVAALLVFAVGFRLLPRLLVVQVPRPPVAVVLLTGAAGPALLAVGLPAGPLVHAGAALEATAVVGFALVYTWLFARSERDRIGFYGVFAGVALGVAGVAVGLVMAFDAPTARLAVAHARLNVLGFLGLVVVGVTYQFYPPGVGSFPGAGERTAGALIVLLAGGVAVHAAGLVLGMGSLSLAGAVAALAGGLGHALLLWGLFAERY